MQLTLQENVSEAEDEEDHSDFMETGYKLRDELLPPVLSPEQSQSMSSLKKAKMLQKMFDDQIQKLSTNKLLTAILELSRMSFHVQMSTEVIIAEFLKF